MTVPEQREGSASIESPDYWWYTARSALLEAALADHVGSPSRVLDVGSADGPSVTWMRGDHHHVSVDLDPRGLRPGQGVRASALTLPFRDASFDVVAAFDVVEHCDPEAQALAELRRVLRPGGRLLLSVPAYEWAWTDHDVRAGHHRRYTRPRLLAAVRAAGFDVHRCSYGFAGVFPAFAAERLLRRVRPSAPTDEGLPQPSPLVERALLGASRVEARWLRRRDLPFGSSIFLAGQKPV
ncbi:class I SAM-dependent methyltransferase [Nocardioides sp. GXQ0305]|uniref:class I SAM-dependent methyltransferase n=1 Tax=Nocardioides sp. GXQ0305 TaxID=3423912 RepID=UPI003D7C6088